MLDFLRHLFIPHEHNNFRAKILHNSSIFIIIFTLFFALFIGMLAKDKRPDILGIAYSISENDILIETNRIREENNLPPLKLNEALSKAASKKARDMFSKNYWNHYGPNGSSPWEFIKNEGYSYVYAGENLAKGFTSSGDIVRAWMNSETHKGNILSDKYIDIGIGILDGNLQGEDTVLVVEMFGAQTIPPVLSAKKTDTANSLFPSANIKSASDFNPTIKSNPYIDSLLFGRILGGLIIAVLLLAFTIDMLVVEWRKVPRMVGHNLDHIILITLFSIFLFITTKGGIL